MKEFKKLESLKQSKILSVIKLTSVKKHSSENDFIKALIKEKRIDNPLIPKEKGSAFRYLFREYIFKFSLVKDGYTSAFYAGKIVNLILKKAFSFPFQLNLYF